MCFHNSLTAELVDKSRVPCVLKKKSSLCSVLEKRAFETYIQENLLVKEDISSNT